MQCNDLPVGLLTLWDWEHKGNLDGAQAVSQRQQAEARAKIIAAENSELRMKIVAVA